MTTGQRVLVVDGLTETQEVLKAVLEPQGLAVDRIRHHMPADEASQRPDVVVIHQDDRANGHAQSENWNGVPTVVIGSVQTDRVDSNGEQYLAKPFQYGDLICAIERLLAKSA